jgi:hypothetical protein
MIKVIRAQRRSSTILFIKGLSEQMQAFQPLNYGKESVKKTNFEAVSENSESLSGSDMRRQTVPRSRCDDRKLKLGRR